VNSTLAAHRRRLLLDNPAFDYYPANGDVLVPRVGPGLSLTFTRTGTAGMRVNSSGQYVTCAANEPRIDYDPDTGRCLGLLVEEQRNNYFQNCTAPATHDSGALTTGNHTLWIRGAGSVAVAAKTATITGAGSATQGSPVTFNVTVAGTVTFTVTGSVTVAQCEKGAFATSLIYTAGAGATRYVDTCTIALGDWFNAAQGTILVEADHVARGAYAQIISFDDGDTSDRYSFAFHSTNAGRTEVYAASAAQVATVYSSGTYATGEVIKAALSYKANDFGYTWNGEAGGTDTSGTLPTVTYLRLGHRDSPLDTAAVLNGHIRRIRYYDRRIPNDQLKLMTTAW